ncbi:MAG TPA: LuxR C-terminal-related transcriptional regulator, partial [Rhodothermales bacterium]|nr:LuxR C-terminal-related transcriptional regulator [Rhodothermales bacterium]
ALARATEGLEEGDALLMRLLLPAFRATASLLQQAHRQYEAFDALGLPIVLTGADGRTLHRTPSFERLVSSESDPLPLTAAISDLARTLVRSTLAGGHTSPAPCLRSIRTAGGSYELRAALTGPAPTDAGPAVVVTVAPQALVLPTPEELEGRFGLTRREAEVALLLAEGLPNDDLAERLFISPHTARRHTERVLAKLNVGTRGAVARRLMEG